MRWAQAIRERNANRRRRALAGAVWALPIESRRAMFNAVENEELIVGAYTDRRGRICPTVAAFRRGARSCVGAFPGAWDAFAGARRPRPATQRELDILRALLEESLAETTAASHHPQPEAQLTAAGT
jgi:hypothetical protein